MTTRSIAVVAGSVIALGALAGLGAVSSVVGRPEPVEVSRPVPVDTLTLQPANSLIVCRTYTGVLRAGRASELGFELAGKLQRVLVDEGDRVVAGQILAELDKDSLLVRKQELQAERAQAAALLAELEAGPRREQISAAAAEVDNLRAQWQLAQVTHQRRDQLRRGGVVSQEEYDQQAFGLQAARARLDAAQRRLDELEAGTRLEQVDAQRAVVARLDAALQQIELDLDDSQLRSPFAGTIATRYVDEGTVVGKATPVLRIVDRSRLEAWIGLPPGAAAGIERGQQHRLQINGRAYETTVSGIMPELDPQTRTRSIVFQLDANYDELVAGQMVRLAHAVEQRDAGFWLPVAALTRGDRGLWSVLAVAPAERAGAAVVERRDVELLHAEGDRVFVRGTLSAEDQVVAGGTHRLVPGQRVEVTAAGSPTRAAEEALAATP